MTITRDTLIRLTREIMEEPLRKYGFEFSIDRFEYESGFFGFFKKAEKFDLYLFLEFQPSGFSDDEIVDLFINLQRTDVMDLHYYKTEFSGDIEKFYVRLSNWIFRNKYQDPHKEEFHVAFEETARGELAEALTKIIEYGIPFMEDPKSSVLPFYGSQSS